MVFSDYQEGVTPIEQLLTNAAIDLAEIVHAEDTRVTYEQSLDQEQLPYSEELMFSPMASQSSDLGEPSQLDGQSQIYPSPQCSEPGSPRKSDEAGNKAVTFAEGEPVAHKAPSLRPATPYPVRRSSRIQMRQSLETVAGSPSVRKRELTPRRRRSTSAKRSASSSRAGKRKSSKQLSPAHDEKRGRRARSHSQKHID